MKHASAPRPTGPPLFAPLPTTSEGWACIACDAGIHFKTWSARGQGRAPSQHYRDHAPETLMTLPLLRVVARDAWLWLWWPDVHQASLVETMSALGFKFSGKAFTWTKTRRLLDLDAADDPPLQFGLGKTTRKQSESCWLGRRGKPVILSHSVREVIVAPVREHSRKPDEFYARVEAFCPGPRLDLFGRETRKGWTVYGDETDKFDRVEAGP